MATSLVDYEGSSSGDDDGDENIVEIDYVESLKVLSSLKKRILIDSTPTVPYKVGGANNYY